MATFTGFCFSLAVAATIAWFVVRLWYSRLTDVRRMQVQHTDGRSAPCDRLMTLLGNLPIVYRAANRLAAYNGFHERFGDIVLIFWLWRFQVSVSGYPMASRILVANQRNYPKRKSNWVIQRLFGSSVLTENGDRWRRHRALMRDTFSLSQVSRFHDLFVREGGKVTEKWERVVSEAGGAARIDVWPELTALFLDIIGKAAFSHDFRAINGNADQFLLALNYIVHQSTLPVHIIAPLLRYMPTNRNRRLAKSFETVDAFLMDIIRKRRTGRGQAPVDLLQSMLTSLNDREVRDNLLAIIVNGHQTVAVSVAMSLDLLARNRDKLRVATAEVDRVLAFSNGALAAEDISKLEYLDAVICESLRLCPPVAGFQRVAEQQDTLDGWSIPAGQIIGISLMPLHANAEYFGELPEQFRPERYMASEKTCPFSGARLPGAARPPLTFGAGARRCLGEHFAIHEMKAVLALLLSRFDFRADSTAAPSLELEKFGLFLSARPATGVPLTVTRRNR